MRFVEPIHQSQTIPSTVYQLATRIITSARTRGWQQVAQHMGQVDLTIAYTLMHQSTTKPFVEPVPMQIVVQLFGPVRSVAHFHDALEQAEPRLGLKHGRGQMVGDCYYGSATLIWRLSGQELQPRLPGRQQQMNVRPIGQSSLSFQEVGSS